jgi:membrane protein
MWALLKATWQNFVEDECPRLAASLAYYTFFAMPALLVSLVFFAGLVINDEKAVTLRLREHLEETIGASGAEQLSSILQNASAPRKSWTGWLVGMSMLVLGASGALVELQTALNRAWGVTADTTHKGFGPLVKKRLLSLGLLVGIALLLLASLVASWALAAFGEWLDAWQLAWLPSQTMRALHTAASMAIFTLLFAALLHFLPDAHVPWSDVWLGAAATAVLFWVGQWMLSVYLGWSKPTSAYGAAGSLALVLLWIYYSALIFLFGAEFTQALAQRRGKRAAPVAGAKRVDRQSAKEFSQPSVPAT